MTTLPLGWTTDLAVLRLGGSLVDDQGDHLVVRSPHNPLHHWGNFVLVTDPSAVSDGWRWQQVFAAEFPSADWLAVGLVELPDDSAGWDGVGARLEREVVLVRDVPPALGPVPDGYRVQRLASEDDWAALVELDLAERVREGGTNDPAARAFARASATTRARLVADGVAAWVGAFAGTELAAALGIVNCGGIARYQSVSTAAAHRRHGLASHLLAAAGAWAAEQGCDTWVIIADPDSDGERLYRRLGFVPAAQNAQAYR